MRRCSQGAQATRERRAGLLLAMSACGALVVGCAPKSHEAAPAHLQLVAAPATAQLDVPVTVSIEASSKDVDGTTWTSAASFLTPW